MFSTSIGVFLFLQTIEDRPEQGSYHGGNQNRPEPGELRHEVENAFGTDSQEEDTHRYNYVHAILQDRVLLEVGFPAFLFRHNMPLSALQKFVFRVQ